VNEFQSTVCLVSFCIHSVVHKASVHKFKKKKRQSTRTSLSMFWPAFLS